MKYSIFSYTSNIQIKTIAPLTDFTILFYKKMEKIFEEAYIHHVIKDDFDLKFSGIFFRFIWNGFNRFNGISSGIIKIEEVKGKLFLNYKIYFKEIFFISLFFSMLPILGFYGNIFFQILGFAIVWAVYIGNNILAANRLKSLFEIIEKEINEMPEYKREIEFRKELKNAPLESR